MNRLDIRSFLVLATVITGSTSLCAQFRFGERIVEPFGIADTSALTYVDDIPGEYHFIDHNGNGREDVYYTFVTGSLPVRRTYLILKERAPSGISFGNRQVVLNIPRDTLGYRWQYDLLLMDLDSDGDLDIYTFVYDPDGDPGAYMAIMENLSGLRGAYLFGTVPQFIQLADIIPRADHFLSEVMFADLNSDLLPDLVLSALTFDMASERKRYAVLLHTGQSALFPYPDDSSEVLIDPFGLTNSYIIPGAGDLLFQYNRQLTDVDGDSDIDLLYTGYNPDPAAPIGFMQYIQYFQLNEGSGTASFSVFPRLVDTLDGSPGPVYEDDATVRFSYRTFVDLDLDGDLDVLSADLIGNVSGFGYDFLYSELSYMENIDTAGVIGPPITIDTSTSDTAVTHVEESPGRELSPHLEIRPNPFTSSFDLELHGISVPVQVLVLDGTGRIVKQRELYALRHNIRMEDMPPGIYFIMVNNAGSSLSEPIIKPR